MSKPGDDPSLGISSGDPASSRSETRRYASETGFGCGTRTRGSQMDPRRIITETNLKTSHRHAARFDRCRSSSHFCGCYGLRVFDADRVLCRHTVPSLASRKLLILLLCAVVPSSAQYARLVPV